MLDVQIAKNYGAFSLQAEFQAGREIVGIIGPSGCGKSLTLRSIAGIETPAAGRVVLNGNPLFDAARRLNVPPRERNIGYVFQHYALFPHLTVAENVGFGLKALTKEERDARVADMLATVRLDGYEDRYPGQLSGGQQQRVALARTLVTGPELLLLDEPFAALDTHVKQHLMGELLEIVRRKFVGTVLLVTHNIEEAYRLCDRLLVYSNGANVQFGTKAAILEQPATVEVAHITGCRNFIDVAVTADQDGLLWARAGSLTLSVARRPAAVQPRMVAGIRDQHLRLTRQPAGTVNTFPCRLGQVVAGTFSATVTVDCQGQALQAELAAGEWQALSAGPGDTLYVELPPENLFLMPPAAETACCLPGKAG